MATNISRAFFLSATTSSPTPFLYQTRTLAPISLSLRRTFDARVRQYSAQNRAAHDYERSESSFASDQDGLSQDSSSQRSGSGSETHQPRRSYLRRRSASLSPKVRGKAQAPSSKSTKGSSTVTGQERKAFGELLGQLGIGRDDGNAHAGDTAEMQGSSSEGQERIKELMVKFGSILKDVQEKNKPSVKSKRELQRAADTESGIPFSGGLSGDSSSADGSSEDMGGPKLRISDLGYTEPASATSVEPEITMREAIEFVVKKESEKIEFALFQAIEEGKGDMGLWEVCKERIFSVLHHLDGAAEITMPGSSNSSDANEASGAKQTTPSAGPLRIPSVIPIGPVITELYPKTLLIAFRLLNTHFPESPLIGQFRSTIKEQGRASALLGSSVALYDEMIHFYWHGCNDLPAVVSFLHDMDVTGLEPSFRTRRLLKDIVRQRQRDKDTQEQLLHGQESFWEFPPNKKAFEELAGRKGWLEKLKARARESHKQRRGRFS